MKTVLHKFLLICIILINVNSSFSQTSGKKTSDSTEIKEEVKNSLKSGRWSIQFGIGTDFTLTNFDDALLALKYNFSSKSALRLDFNLNYFNRQNSDSDYISSQTQAYGGSLSFLYYINPKERFNIYFSLGINHSYNYSYSRIGSGDLEGTYTKRRSWITGPKIGAGAEFFVFRSMSLFAEYNYIFGFGGEDLTEGNNGIPSRVKEWDLTSLQKDNVKFGLSVYF